jgi:hypothetical protein
MSVVHVTGIPLTVRGRVIQRCGLCGRLLLDSAHVESFADAFVLAGTPKGVANPTYPAGRFLRCERDQGRLPTNTYLLDVGDELPVDSCYFSPQFNK